MDLVVDNTEDAADALEFVDPTTGRRVRVSLDEPVTFTAFASIVRYCADVVSNAVDNDLIEKPDVD